MKPHLRVTLRQPAVATEGAKYAVMNDGVEVIGDTGEIVADLSSYVRSVEVIDQVGAVRMVRLEMYAGEICAETEAPRASLVDDDTKKTLVDDFTRRTR